MLLIEAKNIEKNYGGRKILDIADMKIYSEDRIGIVGLNGSGKTTLVNILYGSLKPDKGLIKCYGKISYIGQLEALGEDKVNNSSAAKFNIASKWNKTMSGGEKTRFKIAEAFEGDSNILFADEPTSNLDIEGVKLLEKRFINYKGAIVLISHDRELLDGVCNKIFELADGKVIIYKGNYTNYRDQKKEKFEKETNEYESYKSEKLRLQRVVGELKHKVKTMNKTPKRMGNSEARLHRLGNQKAEANIDNSAKRISSRIEQLGAKEKPKEIKKIKFDVNTMDIIHKKILISGKDINKAYGNRKIFINGEFDIYNGTKTALIGCNGSGKTTLLRMILRGEAEINTAEKLKIGYFSQDFDILNEDKSILENVMETSTYDETFARILLSRLLFKSEDIQKRISMLSGGERVKVSFVKIFLQNNNILILDEPTNYLDTYSLEAVEEVFSEYEGTILFVSHDRHFISNIADRIIEIKDNKLICFNGSYKEYISQSSKDKNRSREELTGRISLLENKRSELIGKLSTLGKKDNKGLLEEEYKYVMNELKQLKDSYL
jgi:macrolide transport system ATP-binding/permease protein